MNQYYFEHNKFIIENYLEKSTFSNFLPGLAGKHGIPLWAFYVNRGQGISGFGLQDKNRPIMEFTPANKAYESVGTTGFRTFLKVNGTYYEPFLPNSKNLHSMSIQRSSFSIEEENKKLGVKTIITYFGLPNEEIGALGRKVEIKNISNKPLHIEGLDGIAQILPAGVKNHDFKSVSNLLSSWMDVDELDNNLAFYKLRSSTGDTSEVKKIREGNFLLGMVNGLLTKPIVDPSLIFGFDSSKREAIHFMNNDILSITKQNQVTVNQVPSGFIPFMNKLNPNEVINVDTFIGFTYSKSLMYRFLEKAQLTNYIDLKQKEATDVIEDLVNDVSSSTNLTVFDEFIKQSYLDNLLRGGYPIKLGNSIYHLYSRRHGDLERDYNFFSIDPAFYSQGGGNFRDVCQNRRLDSFISRDVKSHNIKHFASLIQLDGFNPLTVNGLTYKVESLEEAKDLVNKYFDSNKDVLLGIINNNYTPGGLANYITINNVITKVPMDEYLEDIVSHSKSYFESMFSEGYWIDHFTYLLDLVEVYQSTYPDKMKALLFDEKDILSFESPVTVLPRTDKSVLTKNGDIRQYGSILHHDQDKISRLNLNIHGSNWAKVNQKEYKTNLFTKLLILVANKHSQLDPDNLGVEMESEKPGWNDAMNGLPGLFGSGISETIELKRIVDFLLKNTIETKFDLPIEIDYLFKGLKKSNDYLNRLNMRETYREQIRFGLSGQFKTVSSMEITEYLHSLANTIKKSLDDLLEENPIPPTYVVHEVKAFEEIKRSNKSVIGNYNLPLVKPTKFEKRFLPNFLEAPARLLKTETDKKKLLKMYQAIKASEIYDKKLKIFKTSCPLENEDYDIGRIRAFTPGWLERESDFLHMTYKFLIGLLKAGLYEEYFEEIKHNLVCFMDPNVYGRSTLENSSFIIPSNNPNPHIHGKGFLPRLSGSTIEALDMWKIMMVGDKPFRLKNNKLIFSPKPILTKEFFKKDKTVSFKFMKDTEITYFNEKLVNTYESCNIIQFDLFKEGVKETVYADYLNENQALKLRDGFYNKIYIYIR